MSLQGSLYKPHKLPANSTPPYTPSTRVSSATDKSWQVDPRFLEKDYTTLTIRSRPLTVYDMMPRSVTGKNYTKWADDWLPRMAESRGVPGQKLLNVHSRNPVGFAISPRRRIASTNDVIGPTVLHFQKEGKSTTRVSHTRKKKQSPRIYTKSPFRKTEPQSEKDKAFDDARPLTARKRMCQRPVTPSTVRALPTNYKLPVEGNERQKMSAIFPQTRMENFMEPEKRKYVVLSQALDSSGKGGVQKEGQTREVLTLDSELEQFGIRPDPYNMIRVTITKKGTLHQGYSLQKSNSKQREDRLESGFAVVNTSRSTYKDTVRVKDILMGTNTPN